MKMFSLLGKLIKLSRKEPCGQEVSHRLQQLHLWLELQQGGKSSHEAARLLGLGRATLYRWAGRLDKQGLEASVPKARALTAFGSANGHPLWSRPCAACAGNNPCGAS